MNTVLTLWGLDWRIVLDMALLPQQSVDWWEQLLKTTRAAPGAKRREWLQRLMDYIQSPEAIENYRARIPDDVKAYKAIPRVTEKVPSETYLRAFQRRRPKLVQMIQSELDRDRRN